MKASNWTQLVYQAAPRQHLEHCCRRWPGHSLMSCDQKKTKSVLVLVLIVERDSEEEEEEEAEAFSDLSAQQTHADLRNTYMSRNCQQGEWHQWHWSHPPSTMYVQCRRLVFTLNNPPTLGREQILVKT